MSEMADQLHPEDDEGSVVDQESFDVAAGPSQVGTTGGAIAGRGSGSGANAAGAQGGAEPVGEALSRGGETAAGPTSPTHLGGSTSSSDDEAGRPSSA